eukprot:scaffold30611_cov62-Attheya_sp.AAC.1
MAAMHQINFKWPYNATPTILWSHSIISKLQSPDPCADYNMALHPKEFNLCASQPQSCKNLNNRATSKCIEC